jgi:hypothetical protein
LGFRPFNTNFLLRPLKSGIRSLALKFKRRLTLELSVTLR